MTFIDYYSSTTPEPMHDKLELDDLHFQSARARVRTGKNGKDSLNGLERVP